MLFQSRFILFSNFLMRLEYNDLYCARSPKWKTTSVKRLQNIVGSRSKIWKVLEFSAVDSWAIVP